MLKQVQCSRKVARFVVATYNVKKVLTLKAEFHYQRGCSKTGEGILPRQVLCLFGNPLTKKTNVNATGKKKEHTRHVFIESA